QAEDGIRDFHVTGVQTCALPISQLLYRSAVWTKRRRQRACILFRRSPAERKLAAVGVCGGRWTGTDLPQQSRQSRHYHQRLGQRSEERRVGKEIRSRWSTWYERE